MNRAMYAAASGMAAQQAHLDVVANNLANADVIGFKGSVATFSELAVPGSGGIGTAQSGAQPSFTPGKLAKTGGPFDVAIDGPGFFAVMNGEGATALTRNGEFSRAPDGKLYNAPGWHLASIKIPADATHASVDPDGRVWINRTRHARACIGRIRIADVASPEHLESLGSALWRPTKTSGAIAYRAPGSQGAPPIAFGMLERSNVSIVEAMMEILAAQRSYEANAKGVQAADEMQRIANNLHRG